MTEKQQHALLLRETDVQGTLKRMGGDEKLYLACLEMFLEDHTVEQLNNALQSRAWDDAFTAAHALKGVAGNMGFVPLMYATGQLVIMLRAGRIEEIDEYLTQVNRCYNEIIYAIREYLSADYVEEC